jgi:hypothetical protein
MCTEQLTLLERIFRELNVDNLSYIRKSFYAYNNAVNMQVFLFFFSFFSFFFCINLSESRSFELCECNYNGIRKAMGMVERH